MNRDPLRNADDLLSRIREMEDQGQTNEAIALAREASGTFAGVYDWAAEVARLEQEGKLARPYREGVEALAEGDADDAARLLAWVVGKAPRYREAARYLFWAVEGRDPYAMSQPEAEMAPPSLLRSTPGAWSSPGVWLVLVLVAAVAFGAGWRFAPASVAPAPAAEAVVEAPAPETPTPTPAAAPEVASAPAAAPAPAVEPAPAVPAPSEAAPVAAKAESAARTPRVAAAAPVAATQPDHSARCDASDAHACFQLGDDLYYGRAVPKDLAGAMRAYSRACELREPRGCYNAGDMADKGESGARDKSKALTLFGRGCALGDGQSCSRKSFLEVETTDVP